MLCFLYSQGPAIVIVICWRWWCLNSVNNLIKDLCWNNQFTVTRPYRSWRTVIEFQGFVKIDNQKCVSIWAIYFSEKHIIIRWYLSGSCGCFCTLEMLMRSFMTNVLAGCPFQTHKTSMQSTCWLLCPLLRCR